MNLIDKPTEQKEKVNAIHLEKVISHIDHVLDQFRMRIVHTKVTNPLTEFTKKGLEDLREIDHNHWIRVMNSYFIRLKTYFLAGHFFISPGLLNELSNFYIRKLININNSTMDDYENTIIYLFDKFSKNSIK
mgnify:CR=1 FL=1